MDPSWVFSFGQINALHMPLASSLWSGSLKISSFRGFFFIQTVRKKTPHSGEQGSQGSIGKQRNGFGSATWQIKKGLCQLKFGVLRNQVCVGCFVLRISRHLSNKKDPTKKHCLSIGCVVFFSQNCPLETQQCEFEKRKPIWQLMETTVQDSRRHIWHLKDFRTPKRKMVQQQTPAKCLAFRKTCFLGKNC